MSRPILICYDGSDGARNAISAAAALLVGRSAVVLNVGPLQTVAEGYAALGSGAAELDHVVFDAALAQAEAGAEVARRAGFTASARGEVDAPTWHAVVEVANDIDADVIVLGSRGLTGVHELLEGSLSHEVAKRAGRPVLIVPPTTSRSPGRACRPSRSRTSSGPRSSTGARKGGDLQFDRRGRLYVGMGDGGTTPDSPSLVNDPDNRGQDLKSRLGKLLSIDPLARSAPALYNPKVKLRGKGVVVASALSYGHDFGDCSIVGGYVYRGSQVAAARGRYFFGDFCSGFV